MPNKTSRLRIGICGSASVGKTTLANALARELRLPCLREEMRDYLEATGTELAALAAAETEAVLLRLWREREQKELATEVFVADNCPLDFAAYALYYGCLSPKGYDALLAAALPYLARYDAVFVLPWGVVPYEQDGIRPSDQYLQLRYQMVLEGLLRRHVPESKLHFLPATCFSVEDRCRWIASRAAEIVQKIENVAPRGIVYLVGAGPGDPKLLTLRAIELLQQADVVAHDLLVSPEILAQIPSHVELLPVGRRNGSGSTNYRLHPEVMARARQGKRVLRLKCGDPLLFGRGGEEAEELREAGIPFEIVPGITAALGAASYAGIPLTYRGYSSQILLTTGHEAEKDTRDSAKYGPHSQRTTVLYMAARRLQINLDRLYAEGYTPDTPAALVASATTPRQQVFTGTLATLSERVPELPPHVPAILFAGNTVTLRKHLQWFQTGHLRGRRIVVARARAGTSHIASSLRLLGAEVFEEPSVSVTPLHDDAELRARLTALRSEDVLVFACAPGVEAALSVMREPGGEAAKLNAICIGEQAAKVLAGYGISPRAVLMGCCGEALKAHAHLFVGSHLLLMTSSDGRPGLAHELRLLGADVEPVIAYRVVRQFVDDPSSLEPIDLVILPSSSAAHHFLTSPAGTQLRDVPTIAMGPHTKMAAIQCGAKDVTCASHDDVDIVISAALEILTADNDVVRYEASEKTAAMVQGV